MDYDDGEIERGIARLTPAAEGENPDPEVLLNLAGLRIAWGETESGRTLLEKAVAIRPDFALAHGNLGHLHLQAGDLPRAEQSLRHAIAADHQVAEFHNNLGIVHRRQLRFDDAGRDFERAIDLDSKFREAHHNLALLYKLYLFDDGRAKTHYRRVLDLGGQTSGDVQRLFDEEKGAVP
jgi:Flp pilus assembly protein TadD